MADKKVPKKRGRKPKTTQETKNTPPKKRGRKPKGGKIVKKKNNSLDKNKVIKPNIILHLKCFTSELSTNIFFEQNNEEIKSYPILSNKNKNIQFNSFNIDQKSVIQESQTLKSETNLISDEDIELKEIWEKLRSLKYKLHTNDVLDKKSNCFWCTHKFSNPPIFIPKQERNKNIEVYGCFCSPECAVAFLKNEPIDTATLWERYALLNNIYGKIYDYTKSIKPAPNPYYTLERFYGNLTIQEYRKLLKNDRLLLVVEKPLTKIMPELYEENNENPIFNTDMFIQDNKCGFTQYRLQRKIKKNTKKSIIESNFNMGYAQ